MDSCLSVFTQRGRWALPVLLLALAMPALSGLALAAPDAGPDPFPAEPILRLDPGGHTARIWRIDVDAGERWVVSGSDDKTVRVWRLADGRLEGILRVPAGAGDLGKVFAVAISPDGGLVVAGGWTGPGADQQNIYIFDRADGRLRHRIPGLPNVVTHLAFSPDGRSLAAMLGGANGLRVYGVPTERDGPWPQVFTDPGYGSRSYWAAFAQDGRLATSSCDGRVRLYGRGFERLADTEPRGGKRPYGLDFSPDGRRLAVGYDDNTAVEVLDGQTLAPRFAADTKGADNGDLGRVAWSADGKTLLAGGRYADGDWSPIRRWQIQGQGTGPFTEIRPATDTVMVIRPLRNGRFAVGAQDAVLLLDQAGKTLWSRPLAAADLRGQLHEKGIRVSHTGDRIAFGFAQWGERPALFSLPDLTLKPAPINAAMSGLALPDEGPREGLPVTDWFNSEHPKLDGKPLALIEFERARSLALDPERQRFVLGTEWSLRAYDATGRPLWPPQPVPGAVWALNLTGDGRYAVAGYGDGTLRWHRMTDGAEVLALYAEPDPKGKTDGRRWVLWTPDGHYTASPGGEDLIGWQVNRGPDRAPDFYPASRFREQFYRPDMIARVLETADPAEALRLADQARGVGAGTRAIADLLPPTVAILDPADGSSIDSGRIKVFYKANSPQGAVTRVEARVDGGPGKVLEDTRDLASADGRELAGHLTLEVPPVNLTLELIAYNSNGASVPAGVVLNWSGAEDWRKPELWVLAVGISAHPVESARLKWAADDARGFVERLRTQEGDQGLYKKVHVRLLPDGEATREAVLDGLDWIERNTNARDVAMVFLAGHGFTDAVGEYYFLPYDGTPDRLLRSAVNGDDFRRFLSRVSGKKVLFLDTCYSGGLSAVPGQNRADPRADATRFANELADAQSGVVVFASSTGKQLSQERDEWRHGAFTKALLEGLGGQADYTNDWFLYISELDTWLSERVSALTGGEQRPVSTKPQAVENYRLLKVAQ